MDEAAILIADGRGESVSTTLAVGGRDGIEVSMQFVHVWTAREGQVVRFRGYPTLDQALEAVSV